MRRLGLVLLVLMAALPPASAQSACVDSHCVSEASHGGSCDTSESGYHYDRVSLWMQHVMALDVEGKDSCDGEDDERSRRTGLFVFGYVYVPGQGAQALYLQWYEYRGPGEESCRISAGTLYIDRRLPSINEGCPTPAPNPGWGSILP